ncbi:MULTISPECIES: cupin domain-containing protein [unclassified Blastococcus]
MEPLDLPGPPGVAVVPLPAGAALPRCRARRADVVLVVLAGCPEVAVGDGAARPAVPGDVLVCPRGAPWTLRAGPLPARLVVVAFPAGPERAVAVLAGRPRLDDAARVGVAADGGLELVLEPAPPG